MTSNEIDTLISKAQRALLSGDKKTACLVIHQILKEDFTNDQAWQLLHQLYNDSSFLDDFKIQFAQKYYPDKVNLLQAVSEQRVNKSGDKIIDNTQPAPKPKTKKCTYCAEETLAEEKFCHHCGHDLSKEYPKEIVKERNFLGLTPVETKLLGVLSIIGLSMIAIFISILQQSNSTRTSIGNKSNNTPIPTVAIFPTPRPSPTSLLFEGDPINYFPKLPDNFDIDYSYPQISGTSDDGTRSIIKAFVDKSAVNYGDLRNVIYDSTAVTRFSKIANNSFPF
jgi:hypothetical protein